MRTVLRGGPLGYANMFGWGPCWVVGLRPVAPRLGFLSYAEGNGAVPGSPGPLGHPWSLDAAHSVRLTSTMLSPRTNTWRSFRCRRSCLRTHRTRSTPPVSGAFSLPVPSGFCEAVADPLAAEVLSAAPSAIEPARLCVGLASSMSAGAASLRLIGVCEGLRFSVAAGTASSPPESGAREKVHDGAQVQTTLKVGLDSGPR